MQVLFLSFFNALEHFSIRKFQAEDFLKNFIGFPLFVKSLPVQVQTEFKEIRRNSLKTI